MRTCRTIRFCRSDLGLLALRPPESFRIKSQRVLNTSTTSHSLLQPSPPCPPPCPLSYLPSPAQLQRPLPSHPCALLLTTTTKKSTNSRHKMCRRIAYVTFISPIPASCTGVSRRLGSNPEQRRDALGQMWGTKITNSCPARPG
jgi:hypothetical protein